jgi:hypothetical protein
VLSQMGSRALHANEMGGSYFRNSVRGFADGRFTPFPQEFSLSSRSLIEFCFE